MKTKPSNNSVIDNKSVVRKKKLFNGMGLLWQQGAWSVTLLSLSLIG